MQNNIQDIEPGVGLGALKFGMLQDDIKEILGLPDEIEIYCYSSEKLDRSEQWHYGKLELMLCFSGEDDWKLDGISINSNFYSFMDLIKIGQTKLDVEKLLNSKGIIEYKLEDWSSIESPDHKLIEIDELSLNLWFDHGELSEIQWIPKFEDDETIIWPYRSDLKKGKGEIGIKRYDTDILFNKLEIHIDQSLNEIFKEKEEHKDLINEFPLSTERENLTIDKRSIYYYLNTNNKVDGSIEARARLIHNSNEDIGWMSIYWDNDLNILDDFLVLED